jgi:hypothetical protein
MARPRRPRPALSTAQKLARRNRAAALKDAVDTFMNEFTAKTTELAETHNRFVLSPHVLGLL